MDQLRTYVAPIADLIGTASLLSWDQETMMPAGGTDSRAHQLGTLAALVHQRYTDPKLGELLAEAQETTDSDSFSADVVRAVKRQYDLRTRVPAELVVRRTELSARARDAWKRARTENDFASFAPYLRDQFVLAREYAEHLGYESNPYDALLDAFEPDTSYDWISERFRAYKPEVRRIIENTTEARAGDPTHDEAAQLVRRTVPMQKQIDFGRRLAEAVGYDFQHGRLDLSAHPFTAGSSYLDVRLTTRVDENYLPSCLFACIHEAGHGIHGQNLDPQLYRLPFRYGLGIGESQSRFYENMIGRSRAFWDRHYAALRSEIDEYSSVEIDDWYRAINAVKPSLIRVEADEVTYGMHILLRFELENAVINDELAVDDLPGEWNERMHAYLGIRPERDGDGVLQDIHWSQGGIGYFPDYLLGSMLSAQLWDALVVDIPNAEAQIEAGEMRGINRWMRERVQAHGGRYTFAEIAEVATGRAFSADSYLGYLKRKFGELYGF
jgi:carboxypeptidase Taq